MAILKSTKKSPLFDFYIVIITFFEITYVMFSPLKIKLNRLCVPVKICIFFQSNQHLLTFCLSLH